MENGTPTARPGPSALNKEAKKNKLDKRLLQSKITAMFAKIQ